MRSTEESFRVEIETENFAIKETYGLDTVRARRIDNLFRKNKDMQ